MRENCDAINIAQFHPMSGSPATTDWAPQDTERFSLATFAINAARVLSQSKREGRSGDLSCV